MNVLRKFNRFVILRNVANQYNESERKCARKTRNGYFIRPLRYTLMTFQTNEETLS